MDGSVRSPAADDFDSEALRLSLLTCLLNEWTGAADLAETFIEALSAGVHAAEMLDDGIRAGVVTFPQCVAGITAALTILGPVDHPWRASALATLAQLADLQQDGRSDMRRAGRARLLSLQRVAAAVTGTIVLEEALAAIVEECSQLMGNAVAQLRLLDATTGDLCQIATSEASGIDPALDATLAELALETRQPVISHGEGRSLLSVPLMLHGDAVGALTVSHDTEQPFHDGDAEMLSLFADHAAIAIENGRAYERAQAQIAEMEVLAQVSAIVSQSLELASVFDSLHAEIGKILPADAFTIFLRNSNGVYDLVYLVDQGRAYAPHHGVRLPAPFQKAIDERVSLVATEDILRDRRTFGPMGDSSRLIRAAVVAPLVRGDDAIGVISVGTYTAHRYSDHEARLMGTVANVAAVAIEKAQSFQDVQGAAVADERTRLSREIHDTVAQGLVGIILQLETLELTRKLDEAAAQRVARILELARSNLEETRRSVHDLRASLLERHSLAEALQQLAREHRAASTGVITVDLPPTLPLFESQVDNVIFRFVQEALTNCRKHAPNASVAVSLTVDDAVRVMVSDTGPGFEIETWRSRGSSHHFGLNGMVERANQLGGALEIESVLDSGTTLTLVIPIPH